MLSLEMAQLKQQYSRDINEKNERIRELLGAGQEEPEQQAGQDEPEQQPGQDEPEEEAEYY